MKEEWDEEEDFLVVNDDTQPLLQAEQSPRTVVHSFSERSSNVKYPKILVLIATVRFSFFLRGEE